MKVLAVCVPGPGHINPLLPLVAALLEQGDEVLVASGSAVEGNARRAGAQFAPCGHGEMDWFDLLRARTLGFPGDGLPPSRINHYFLPRLFGEIAAADMIDDVLETGRAFRPDVVLFETYALAGPLAAALLGVPAVHHLLGPLVDHDVLELVNDAVSPLWRSFDRDTPGWAGVFSGTTVEICPPSMERVGVPSGERIALRPADAPAPGAMVPQSPPLVYATLGTFFGGDLGFFRDVLSGLADEAVQVLVTVGEDRDPADVGPAPANARVERFVPHSELLPRCAAVVHHGGSGTTLQALAHGLPQVVVPQGADNFINAALVEQAGAGTAVLPGHVAPAVLRDTVRLILDDPGYASAARRVAREIAAMPSPAEVADTLRRRLA